jgi:hypothetical protein
MAPFIVRNEPLSPSFADARIRLLVKLENKPGDKKPLKER